MAASASTPLPEGTRSVLKVASGANHTLLLLGVGPLNDPENRETQLWACGDGRAGQIDHFVNDDADLQSRDPVCTTFCRIRLHKAPEFQKATVVDIAAAWETSYVVTRSHGQGGDSVWAFGSNAFGALGVPEIHGGATTWRLLDFHHLYADALDYTMSVKAIASGPRHAVVILHLLRSSSSSKIILAGWGACRHGELGYAAKASSGRPTAVQSVPVRIELPGETGDPPVDIACGSQHTLVLHASGRVTALGSDRSGQSSAAARWTGTSQVACTWNGSYAVAASPSSPNVAVLAAGRNNHGQLGVAAPDATTSKIALTDGVVHDLACGSEHVLCICTQAAHDDTNTVHPPKLLGWGWNEHGNLGLGHTNDVRTPVNIPLEQGQKPLRVWTGCGTSWVAVHEAYVSESDTA
jgi:protein ATS1